MDALFTLGVLGFYGLQTLVFLLIAVLWLYSLPAGLDVKAPAVTGLDSLAEASRRT